MRLKLHIPFLVLLSLAGIVLPSTRLLAGESWSYYDSDSGIFRSAMPDPHNVNLGVLAVDNKRAVNSEEITALIDQRPFRNAMKSYIVKADQSFGPGLRTDEVTTLLERELDLYEDFYTAYGGTVKLRESKGFLGFPGGQLVMTYKDPKLGEQTVRVRVLFSASTRLEQIFVGPEDVMDSYKTREFFNKLVFVDGISVTDIPLKDAWPMQDSALGLFSVAVPPVAKPFVPQAPIIKKSPQAETFTIVLKDPVRNEGLYYTIYGYRFSNKLTLGDAQTVLKRNHILKYKLDPDSVSMKIMQGPKGSRTLDATYNIPPPKDFPSVQTVRVHAIFQGPNMVVQEVMGSQALVISPFTTTLMKGFEFHPELYHAPKVEVKPEIAGPFRQKPTERRYGEDFSARLKRAIGEALRRPDFPPPAP